MPRFVVLVRRVEVSEAQIAVTARSREEAEGMALRDDDLYFALADNVVDAELEAVSVRELDPNHSAIPLHAGKDTICSLCLRPVRWTGRVEAGRTIPGPWIHVAEPPAVLSGVGSAADLDPPRRIVDHAGLYPRWRYYPVWRKPEAWVEEVLGVFAPATP